MKNIINSLITYIGILAIILIIEVFTMDIETIRNTDTLTIILAVVLNILYGLFIRVEE